MKPRLFDDDDTIFAFSAEKKAHIFTDDSPRRRGKSSAFTVPKYNSHMLEASREELRNDDTVIALINIIICVLSFFHHTLYFQANYSTSELVTNIRIFVFGISVSSILWIYRRYQIKLILMLIKYKISTKDSLFTTGLYRRMLIEILFAFLVMPPYIDYTFKVQMLGFTITYSLSAVFTFFTMVRLYVILRLFGHYSEYTHEKSDSICSKHAVTADAYFALKSYLKISPFVGIGGFFFSMAFFSSLVLYLCEEPHKNFPPTYTINSDLSYLWDDMWVIFYTTTTIGYGNIVPATHFGRAIAIIACILGNMYLGMLVVSINQTMELDDSQNLSYSWISRKSLRLDIKKKARIAIRKFFTLCILSKKWKKTLSLIAPNGIVNCKGVIVRNDLAVITEGEYMTKLKVFREMKKALKDLKDLEMQSREVGTNEIDVIYDFEDAVRIDFPKIVKKTKGKVEKKDVDSSDLFVKACKPAELKASQIKEFSKTFKRKMTHAIKRKTVVMNQAELLKNQNKPTGNFKYY